MYEIIRVYIGPASGGGGIFLILLCLAIFLDEYKYTDVIPIAKISLIVFSIYCILYNWTSHKCTKNYFLRRIIFYAGLFAFYFTSDNYLKSLGLSIFLRVLIFIFYSVLYLFLFLEHLSGYETFLNVRNDEKHDILSPLFTFLLVGLYFLAVFVNTKYPFFYNRIEKAIDAILEHFDTISMFEETTYTIIATLISAIPIFILTYLRDMSLKDVILISLSPFFVSFGRFLYDNLYDNKIKIYFDSDSFVYFTVCLVCFFVLLLPASIGSINKRNN